jgi:DNA-binding Xre family transcriptional regulator
MKVESIKATEVMYFKKMLADPNRKTRLKILAKRFGVSEMTLHRIRTGENWSH